MASPEKNLIGWSTFHNKSLVNFIRKKTVYLYNTIHNQRSIPVKGHEWNFSALKWTTNTSNDQNGFLLLDLYTFLILKISPKRAVLGHRRLGQLGRRCCHCCRDFGIFSMAVVCLLSYNILHVIQHLIYFYPFTLYKIIYIVNSINFLFKKKEVFSFRCSTFPKTPNTYIFNHVHIYIRSHWIS